MRSTCRSYLGAFDVALRPAGMSGPFGDAERRSMTTSIVLLADRHDQPLDSASLDLARLTGADDHVVSDTITSRLMTQLADQPRRRDILLRLYAAGGPSVRLVPAAELGLVGTVGFDDIITTAYAAELLALGWRSGDEVVLNPPTSTRVSLTTGDQVVVVG